MVPVMVVVFDALTDYLLELPEDVLQLSRSGKRAKGRVDQAPSHAATSNSLLMN